LVCKNGGILSCCQSWATLDYGTSQSYLKGYASTWWRIVRQEEGNTHGYTWEFFKERIELEFIPKNFDYISRCKFPDLVNATIENLCQYVRAYSKLMLEI